jgi:hypothetical protein
MVTNELQLTKLRQAEEQVRNARTHFERGFDNLGEAFLRDAERLIAEVVATHALAGERAT